MHYWPIFEDYNYKCITGLELKGFIVKPESEVPKSKVPKSRSKGLKLTLKSHGPRWTARSRT